MSRIKSFFPSSLAVLLTAVLLTALPWIPSGAALAQDEPGGEAVKVLVTARLQVARVGKPLRSSSASMATLGLGESGKLRLGALECRPFAGSSRKHQADAVVWSLSVTLEEVDWDQFTLSYSWSRDDAELGAGIMEAPFEQGRLKLRHDDSVPIDLVRIRRPDAESCDIYVQLGADYFGAAEYRNQAVRQEVWLTHTDPEGIETSTRLDMAGEQGEALGFLFEPMKMGIPSEDRDKEARVTGRVYGHVRSWKTAEDQFLIVVNAQTSISSSVGAVYKSSSSSGHGAKRFHVETGETVKIVIPPFQGTAQLLGAAPKNPLTPGLTSQDGVVIFDAKSAFEGHELALVVRTSALE